MKSNRITRCFTSVALITALLGCSQTKNQESTGQAIDDSAITTKVKTAIFEDQTLKSLQINVKTFKGEVQLSGFVDSSQSAKKAGEVAGIIKDVTSVKNDLIVK
jgi:osmotically-inducible protein OsmY